MSVNIKLTSGSSIIPSGLCSYAAFPSKAQEHNGVQMLRPIDDSVPTGYPMDSGTASIQRFAIPPGLRVLVQEVQHLQSSLDI